MATYPAHGLTDWDDDLKVYIDTAIDERADAGDATVVANAAAAAAATTAAAAASVPKALVDAKGDLIVATADNTVARKAVGPNNSILRADSGDATGVKWGPVLPELSRNLIFNPRASADLTSIGNQGVGSVVTRVTGRKYGTGVQAVTSGAATYQGILFGAVATAVGRTYTVTAEVTATTSGVYRFSTNNGTYIQTEFMLIANVPKIVSHTFSVPSTPVDGGVYVDTSAVAKATTMIVDGITLVEGPDPQDYFDGDTPGCYWTGTPNNSESVKALLSDADVFTVGEMPELARNLIKSPSFGDGTGPPWTVAWSGAGSGDLVTDEGMTALRAVFSTGNPSYLIYSSPLLAAGSTRTLPPSTPITGSILLKGPAGRDCFLQVYSTVDGSDKDVVVGPFITLTGGWQRITVSGSSWAGGSCNIYLILRMNVAAPGETVLVARGQVELGSKFSGWVDGDLPGCRWLGTPHDSESVKMLESKADHDLLVWLDAGRAQGTGSPEGKVTATVGTRYVDTLATTGAIEWIKATGTGNTGWRVTFGDTGWRNVASLADPIWTVASLLVRRVNGSAYCTLDMASAATFVPGVANPLFTPDAPAGFGAASAPYAGGDTPVFTGGGGTQGVVVFLGRGNRNPEFYASSWGGGAASIRGPLSWLTPDPWPTSLPGTPA